MSDVREAVETETTAEPAVPPLVGVLVGSASDLPVMQQTPAILERFEIPKRYGLRVAFDRDPVALL